MAGGETPEVSHVDVDNGLAHVYWDFEPEPETLGYIVYKCLDSGGGAVVADVADPNTFDLLIPAPMRVRKRRVTKWPHTIVWTTMARLIRQVPAIVCGPCS